MKCCEQLVKDKKSVNCQDQDLNGKFRDQSHAPLNWIHIYFSSFSTGMSYVSRVWFRFSCCLFPCIRSGLARQGFLHCESQGSQFSFENPGNVPSPSLSNLMHFHNNHSVPLWLFLITKARRVLSHPVEFLSCLSCFSRGKKCMWLSWCSTFRLAQYNIQRDQMNDGGQLWLHASLSNCPM